MFVFFWSCINSSPMNEQDSFDPALVGIVEKIKWKYKSDCTGLEAYWSTKLPSKTKVQIMMGPKTQNPHFDDDALATRDTMVGNAGKISVHIDNVSLPSQRTFINLRVWGSNSDVYHMLVRSQKEGGFPVAQSPNGPYGWAETTIPPCEP